MSPLILSIIVSGFAKIAMLFVYSYLYVQYRERYMGIWALSWLFICLRLAFDAFIFKAPSIGLLYGYHTFSILSSLFLAWGTYDFVHKGMQKWWIYGAIAVTITGTISLLLHLPIPLCTYPTVLFFAIIYIQAGIAFLRVSNKNITNYITGLAFILSGIHHLDFPILRPLPWFAPVGYLTDAVFRFIIAIGSLLIYFRKTRSDLLEKEKHFRLLAENARDIIYRYRLFPTPRFEYVSPAVTVITGYTPEEFYADSKLWQKIVHQGDRALLSLIGVSATNNTPFTIRLIRKDEKEIWTEQHNVPIYDNKGNLIAIEGIVRDITARKQLEQEISRLDRLNLIGQMAANLAHEIRNPLTTVRGYLQLLKNKKEFSEYKESFDLLLCELDRSNAIITEYLSLSKDKVADLKVYQLNPIIESLFPLIQADAIIANKSVKMELEKLPDLLLDEKEIRQMVLNLARNGLEAMSPGGSLLIRTFMDKGEAVLAVQDEGPGIPPHILDKLGVPFSTTKEQGTGLGLAVCYSIANRHQATIKVKTGPTGTTFFIRFKLPKKQIDGCFPTHIKKLMPKNF